MRSSALSFLKANVSASKQTWSFCLSSTEVVFDFLDDFDKNYELCKDWTNECHIEFLKRIQTENSFLDLYIKGFKKEEKQYKSIF